MKIKLVCLIYLLFLLPDAKGQLPSDRVEQVRKHLWELSAESPGKVSNAILDTINLALLSIQYENPDTALKYAYMVEQWSVQNGYRYGDLRARVHRASSYHTKAQYVEALDIAFSVIKELEAEPNKQLFALTNNVLGVIYQQLRNIPLAISYLEKARQSFKEIGEKQLVANLTNNLAVIYYNEEMYGQALDYYRETLKYSELSDYTLGKGIGNNNVAWVYIKEQKYDSAWVYFKKAEEVNRQINITELGVWIDQGKAEYYLHYGDLDKAKNLAKRALENAISIKKKTKISDCHETLSRVYEARKEGLLALNHFKQFKLLSDEIFNGEVESKSTFLQVQYEFEKRELALKNQQAIEKAQFEQQVALRNTIIALIVVGLIGLSVSVILLQRNRNQLSVALSELDQVSKFLEKQRDELQSSNLSKTKLFSIISHDLRGSIGNNWMLLEQLKSRLEDHDLKESTMLAKLSIASSQTTYRILENLLNWSRAQLDAVSVRQETFKIKPWLSPILAQIDSQRVEKGINLSLDIHEDDELYADKEMIEIVLRNVLSNAIKYTNKNGTIQIKSIEEKGWKGLEIKDTGVGMSKRQIEHVSSFNKNETTEGTSGERGTGLGLVLCHDFIEKNNGRIYLESTVGKGTTVRFLLPPSNE